MKFRPSCSDWFKKVCTKIKRSADIHNSTAPTDFGNHLAVEPCLDCTHVARSRLVDLHAPSCVETAQVRSRVVHGSLLRGCMAASCVGQHTTDGM